MPRSMPNGSRNCVPTDFSRLQFKDISQLFSMWLHENTKTRVQYPALYFYFKTYIQYGPPRTSALSAQKENTLHNPTLCSHWEMTEF